MTATTVSFAHVATAKPGRRYGENRNSRQRLAGKESIDFS